MQVEIRPRGYVLDYLANSFPTHLYVPFTDSAGNLSLRPVFRDDQTVQGRAVVADAALAARAALRQLDGLGEATRLIEAAVATKAQGMASVMARH